MSGFRQFRRQHKRRRGDPRSAARQTQQRCASYIRTSPSPRAQQNGVHGPASIHSTRSRSAITLHTRYFRRAQVFPSTEHRSPNSPAALLSTLPAPMVVPLSTDYTLPWATTCPCFRSCRRPTITPQSRADICTCYHQVERPIRRRQHPAP
jgi:hypothetical protein